MEFIENNILKISLNKRGALITSIIDKRNNEELFYQVEEGSWPFQDVVIFPIIGATNYKENDFKLTSPVRHGFVRNFDFNIFSKKEDEITLLLSSNEDTLKLYPHNFDFFITYKVEENKLIVHTKVVNKDDKEMPFMYGSHSAIKAFENGKIIFDKNYIQHKLVNGLIEEKKTEINQNFVSFEKNVFKVEDTIIIENNFNEIRVDNGKNHYVIYTFNAPLLALWTNPNKGNYICVEPWWGISNYSSEEENIFNAPFINIIKDQKEFDYSLEFKLK